ncbi:GTPase KRas isoform X4 [Prinia subflava]|uniref:GTPase KRas isoform X4 n=1 Tax=Prinia subflava TaxID=208062 RepID=UPI002FE0D8DA
MLELYTFPFTALERALPGRTLPKCLLQASPRSQIRILWPHGIHNGSGWTEPQRGTWCHLPAPAGPSQSTGHSLCPDGSGISSVKEISNLSGQSVQAVFPPAQVELGSVPARSPGAIAGPPEQSLGPARSPPCTQGHPGLRAPLEAEQPQLSQPFQPKSSPQHPLRVSLTLRIPGLDTRVAGCGLEPAAQSSAAGGRCRRCRKGRWSAECIDRGRPSVHRCSAPWAAPAQPCPSPAISHRDGKGRDASAKGRKRRGKEGTRRGHGGCRELPRHGQPREGAASR